ncbi:MAG TPA: hypothetical protein VK766_09480 [Cytophagaceae bacterium]|jgi:hypothetical protein|nr:hypothetical protein [Cytophagaceae bacterium]
MATNNISGFKQILQNIEKILIVLIFVSIPLYYVSTGEKELKSSTLFLEVLALEFCLLLYYCYLTRNLYTAFLLGFIVLTIGLYVQKTNYPVGQKLILIGEITQFCLGLFLGYKTVQESIQNKDWEMFGTLLSLVLMFPLVYHFVLRDHQEYLMVYNFSLAFILATIIYNENLWDKYNPSEKKILTYVLVSTVTEVLFISIKLI